MADISKLDNAVTKYNAEIDEICNKIQQLKITCDTKDIKVEALWSIGDGMSVVNNVKSRKKLESSLGKVQTMLGIYLEDKLIEQGKMEDYHGIPWVDMMRKGEIPIV